MAQQVLSPAVIRSEPGFQVYAGSDATPARRRSAQMTARRPANHQ